MGEMFLLKKRGLWWRPKALGYTSDIKQAGRFSRDEAEIACRNPDVSAHSDPSPAASTSEAPAQDIGARMRPPGHFGDEFDAGPNPSEAECTCSACLDKIASEAPAQPAPSGWTCSECEEPLPLKAECPLRDCPHVPAQEAESDKFLLPDDKAKRYSWEFVRRVAQKARGNADAALVIRCRQIETENAALAGALEPFKDALESTTDGTEPDSGNLWETPAAMSLTYGDLRRAVAALANHRAASGKGGA